LLTVPLGKAEDANVRDCGLTCIAKAALTLFAGVDESLTVIVTE
jgi:hypothetical protein